MPAAAVGEGAIAATGATASGRVRMRGAWAREASRERWRVFFFGGFSKGL